MPADDGADERRTVVHIITGLATGGAERMLQRLVTGESTYRHIVVSLGAKDSIGIEIERAGVEVLALHIGSGVGLVAAFRRLVAIVDEARPVAIQGWMTHGNIAASLVKIVARKKLPVFWGVRQSLNFTGERTRTRLLIYLGAMMARTADVIVYNSQAGAIQHEAIGYPRSRRLVIPNGFSLHEYRPAPDVRRQMRSSLGIRADEIVVGTVGRLHPVKNHEGFLAAAAMIARDRGDVRFLLAGQDVDLEHAPFNRLVEQSGIAIDRLLALGERTDVARVMCMLDIAANVSHAESFPNVVGEALACGVPCVVTPVGDSAFIVGDAGVVCGDTAPNSIADGIRKLLEVGPEGRARMALRGLERMRELFSLPTVKARFDALYRSAGV